MARILLVDDDKEIAEQVSRILACEQHTVETAANAADGAQLLNLSDFDVVVLDWHMPDRSGIDVLREYRSSGGTARVLMLTGRAGASDKEAGLDAGADDYLTKPFDSRELCARIRALLRRPAIPVGKVASVAGLEIDMETFTVRQNGNEIQLNPQEFRLLEFFVRNPNRVFNEDAIITRAWKSYDDVSSDALRSSIKRLRARIDPKGELLKNIRGVGYIFRVSAD